MNRHLLRTACGRTRPDLEAIGVPMTNYFRSFSTTPLQRAEGDPPTKAASPTPTPTPKPRQGNGAPSNSRGGFSRGRVIAAGSRPQAGQGNAPRVVDIKSLPQGLRGRGGFSLRGRGGRGAASRGGSAFRGGGARGSPGRGGARGRGDRGRGAQVRRGGRRGGKNTEGGKDGARARRDGEPVDVPAPLEDEFEKEFRFGARTTFMPSLTLDALREFVPSFPSSGSAQAQTATVKHNLAALGGADPLGMTQLLPPEFRAKELRAKGLQYFADLETRAAVEAHETKARDERMEQDGRVGERPLRFRSTEKPVREAILDRSVLGLYESPKASADPLSTTRSAHLRDGSYQMSQVNRFEKKLTAVLGPAAGKARAEQPRT